MTPPPAPAGFQSFGHKLPMIGNGDMNAALAQAKMRSILSRCKVIGWALWLPVWWRATVKTRARPSVRTAFSPPR
jgi:hypothetical protein